MSRTATFAVLSQNSALNTAGFTQDNIFQNYNMEERPIPTGPFIVLQWGAQDPPIFFDVDKPMKSFERLSLWIHYPAELNEDHITLGLQLDKVDTALFTARDVVGEEGYTLSFVRPTGRSGDFKDTGFNTISRNAGYEVYYR